MSLFTPAGMVGRGEEMSRLDGLLTDLAAGRGAVAWIAGEAGAGKSYLTRVLIDHARELGCEVLIGHADELTQGFPLGLMADCLDTTAAADDPARVAIAGLLGGEPDAAYADAALAAGERMLELVDRMCAVRPVVLIAEDLQWADEPSLVLLDRLHRATGQIPLLLVVTSRQVAGAEQAGSAFASFLRHGLQQVDARLLIQPFGAGEVAAFARSRFGAPPGLKLLELLAAAEGNPLYLGEIINALLARELVGRDSGQAELLTEVTSPASLTDAIFHRLALLDPEHLHTLRFAALLGNEFSQRDLTLILGAQRVPDGVLDAAAAASLVLTLPGDRVMFQHDLIRQALREQIPSALRGGLHAHIAQTLAASGASESVVAAHLSASGAPLNAWGLTWLMGLAEARLYAAPGGYLELLRRSVSEVGEADPRWAELTRRLILSAFWLGHDSTVIELAESLLPKLGQTGELGPDQVARVRMLTLRSYARVGRFGDALEAAAPVLTDQRVSPHWRARLAAWSAITMPYLGRVDEARQAAEQALTQATACADPLAIAYSHHALAYLAGEEQQIEHIDAALEQLGDDPESMDMRLLLLGNRMARLNGTGRQLAEPAVGAALVLAESAGTYRSSTLLAQAGASYYEWGRWDDAITHINQIGPATLAHPSFAYLHGLLALIAFRRDQRDLATRHLQAAGLDTEEPTFSGPTGTYMVEAVAMRAEVSGDLKQALRFRAQYLDLPPGPGRDARCYEALQLVRLALETGDERIARAAADTAADNAGYLSLEVDLAIRCCQAMIAGDSAGLIAIAETYRDHGWTVNYAFAIEEAAVRLADAGDLDRARSCLGEALDIYGGQGAAWEIRRAEARLRPYGIRRGVRGSRRTARTGWESLTDTELKVSQLVARGLSNPDIARDLIISRNTVQTHVSSVLAKLGIRSRIELAHAVALHSNDPVARG
jgi:DNA-binding CsgD family transcriptional regulator